MAKRNEKLAEGKPPKKNTTQNDTGTEKPSEPTSGDGSEKDASRASLLAIYGKGSSSREKPTVLKTPSSAKGYSQEAAKP